ncbi:MAG: NCS2 family permease [Acidobacteriia bacterium]|nr:NCS2 family permease [Terriglobia bacterium]
MAASASIAPSGTTSRLAASLERYFEFEALGATWRTELLAGFTTFITMAYIAFVNPSILSQTGMPIAAVAAATCFSAGIGSLLMGILARYPIALAPGMGLNAYFTYSVVKGMGVPWQVALGAVFVSGVVFLLLTALGVRQLILESIPAELYASVAVGVGLFISLLGLRDAGIVAPSAATMVTIGNLRDPKTILAIAGLVGVAALMARGVRAAILIGVLGTTLLGFLFGQIQWQPQSTRFSDLSATAFRLDLSGVLHMGLLEIAFVFLFVDLFDNIGALLAIGKKAGLLTSAGRIPRANRIFTADALATIVGSCSGTSTVTSYIESSAGVAVGGRTGITAIVVGILFLALLFVVPSVGALPAFATAPALIVVGSLMMTAVREVDWDDPLIAIPAFLTMVTIPLTFSVANGLAIGFITYTVVRVCSGRYRSVSWLVYALTIVFIARFLYLRG